MKLTNSDIKLLKSSRAELLNKGIPAGVVRREVQTQTGKKLFVDSSGDIVDVQGQVIASLDDIKERGWLTRMVFGEGIESEMELKVIVETIVKRGDKWLVMNAKGDKVLGTHDTKKKAEAQLTAIHISQAKSK